MMSSQCVTLGSKFLCKYLYDYKFEIIYIIKSRNEIPVSRTGMTLS
ncbi:hypothetical protein [Wolbachia endosymbiont (group A) of Anomoia purmunda]|nr:hypothetical protein [Wolbachia endosymbiont (group A) of Anomoia purmunda]